MGHFASVLTLLTHLINGKLGLLSTIWGTVPCGIASTTDQKEEHSNFLTKDSLANVTQLLWTIDSFPTDQHSTDLSRDEHAAVNKINEVLSYDQHLQYFTTGLLWKHSPKIMNNSKSAFMRLKNLLFKLSTTEIFKGPEMSCWSSKVIASFFRSLSEVLTLFLS